MPAFDRFHEKKITSLKSFLQIAVLLCALVGVSACSTTATETRSSRIYAGNTEIHDPFESYNRAVFSFNRGVDQVIINPLIDGYRFVVPKPARTGLSNFMNNLKSPIHLANQILQGDLEGSANTLTRAIINTLVGVGGLFDVAGYEGIEHESEDFGQTLAVWGVGYGPYIVAPILGPSSLRDYVGYFVDAYADPLRLYLFNIDEEGWAYARSGVDYFLLRESLIDVMRDLEKNSVDFYASVRSTYYQRRNAMIQDFGRTGSSANIPDFDDF